MTEEKKPFVFLPQWARKRLPGFKDVSSQVRDFGAYGKIEEMVGSTNLKKLHQRIREANESWTEVQKLRDEAAVLWGDIGEFSSEEGFDLLSNGIKGKEKTIKNIAYDGANTLQVDILSEEEYASIKSRSQSGMRQLTHIDSLFNTISVERRNYFVDGEEAIRSKLERLSQIRKKLLEISESLQPHLEHKHTYRVIKNLEGELLKEFQKDHPWARGNTEPHLDENGWPLEVSEDGTVLISPNKKVNMKKEEGRDEFVYTTLCRTIDIGNWLDSEFDAYISDLRDGRFHPNSITVMDIIMDEMGKRDLKEIGNTRQARQAKVTMETSRGEEVSIMRPTHLNPSCDKRGKGKIPLHKGRKYYYDTQSFCEPSSEPTISSRGAALYIVHCAIEGAKFFEQTGEHKGALDLINEISKATDGLDIGPNMDLFGQKEGLFNNPFRRG